MLIHLAFGDTRVRVDTILYVSIPFHEYHHSTSTVPLAPGAFTRRGTQGHTAEPAHEH